MKSIATYHPTMDFNVLEIKRNPMTARGIANELWMTTDADSEAPAASASIETEDCRNDLPAGGRIREEHMREFMTRFVHQQALQSSIRTMKDCFETIRQREIERHYHRFSSIDRQELDRITRAITERLLFLALARLENVSPEPADFTGPMRLLQNLFSMSGCDDESNRAPCSPASGNRKKPSPQNEVRPFFHSP